VVLDARVETRHADSVDITPTTRKKASARGDPLGGDRSEDLTSG
jgi:hypothetical protein